MQERLARQEQRVSLVQPELQAPRDTRDQPVVQVQPV